MDSIAVATVRITALRSEEYTSHYGAGAKENKVAPVRKELQRSMRGGLGEGRRAGSWRRDRIGTSTHYRHRDREFGKALWCDSQPQQRRDVEQLGEWRDP